jgi:hypothetical protein
MKRTTKTPRWETAVMIAAFVLLWAWLLVRHTAMSHGTGLSWVWTLAQLGALAALTLVFTRRMRRAISAMRELNAQQGKGSGPGSAQSCKAVSASVRDAAQSNGHCGK